MAEYIEREAAIAAVRHAWAKNLEPTQFIDEIPAADVAEVRHGRWIATAYTTTSKRRRVISNVKYTCSECGYGNGRKQSNYCPNCGCILKENGDEELLWASAYAAADVIKRQPSVDAAPVRHGHWIGYEDEYGSYIRCSVCADEFTAWEGDCAHTRFCPGCGARMDLEGAENG